MMGLGHALTEELYLEDGRIVNLALSDYKLPCQLDMPPFRVICLEPDGGPGIVRRARGRRVQHRRRPARDRERDHGGCGVRLDRIKMTSERIYDALAGLSPVSGSR